MMQLKVLIVKEHLLSEVVQDPDSFPRNVDRHLFVLLYLHRLQHELAQDNHT